MKRFNTLTATLLIVLVALPSSAFAVGSGAFENASFGSADYGKGGAATANPTNPATISINPAGISELPGVQFQTNAHMINMWTKIESRNPTGGSTQSSGTTNVIPTVYLSVNPGNSMGLNNRLAFGIGVDSPFGLSNKYDSNHTAVHYTGYNNWIKMYSIKPVASFRFADWLSVGAGPIFYRVFDYGQIASYSNSAISAPAPPNGLGIGPTPDGQIRANLSGNAWGWHIGFLAKPAPKHKVGFYFRSPALIRLKGLGKGENILNSVAGATNGKFETGVHTKLQLPLNMTWGYNYQFTEKTDAGFDIGYTRWSSYERANVIVDPIKGTSLGGLASTHDTLLNALFNTPGPGGTADKDYHNAFTLNVGGEHKLTDKFRLRLGSYLYLTPIPKKSFTPVVPDSNRVTFTAGFGYDIAKYLTLDMAYAAQIFMSRTVNNDISEALGTSVDGRYKTFLHIWTAGLTYKFDGVDPKPKTEGVEIPALTN